MSLLALLAVRGGYVLSDGHIVGKLIPQLRPRKRSKKTLAVLIGILVFAAGIGALSALTYAGPAYSVVQGNKHMTMDHIYNGTFSPVTKRIDWVKEGGSAQKYL